MKGCGFRAQQSENTTFRQIWVKNTLIESVCFKFWGRDPLKRCVSRRCVKEKKKFLDVG